MENSTTQLLFIGNHAKRTLTEVPTETLSNFDVQNIIYQRGSLLKNEPAKFVFNDISCDYNGEYEVENLSIAMGFTIDRLLKKRMDTILIGDPFELFFQASIFAWLNENPKNVKLSENNSVVQNLTVILLYPSTVEFENIRKEISRIIYVLKKHKVNTFLIENHFNQASAIDNILYYYNSDEILQLENKVKGLKHILGHVTTA
jgi:hypothetical protein